MRIKKKTSMMLLAASTAAVVGVAAVSFAAWNGGVSDELTASASTGTVYTFGFETADPLNFGQLVPYDQPDKTIEAGSVVAECKLPAYTVYEDTYTISVGGVSGLSCGTLYAFVGAEKPDSTADMDVTALEAAGWQEVTATASGAGTAHFASADITGEATVTAGTVAAETYSVWLILVSETAPSATETIGLTVTLQTDTVTLD